MEETNFDLKRGLNAWVQQNTTLSEFASAMGYKYQNAWGVARGKLPVTVETVGRFALAYGPTALGEMLRLAGLGDHQEVVLGAGASISIRDLQIENTPVDAEYIPAEQAA
jgi:hypothetical protein